MVGMLLGLMIALSIALPVLAAWRVWKITDKKYELYLLVALSINNFLRIWSWSDIKVEFVHKTPFFAKVLVGSLLENAALFAWCLFLLGILDGLGLRKKKKEPDHGQETRP